MKRSDRTGPTSPMSAPRSAGGLKGERPPPSPAQRRGTRLLLLAVTALAALLVRQALPAPRILAPSPPPVPTAPGISFDKAILGDHTTATRVANVQVVDFDGDGLNDILACDVARQSVILYRQISKGDWKEETLGSGITCPVHATLVDLDRNGRMDVVVADLGSIFPSDELVGKVILLENEGGGCFSKRTLLDDVRRVADVQAGDMNGDGNTDLVVGVFGHDRGEVLWMENRGRKEGRWRFRDHHLLDRPGIIHVPLADLDGDGDLDVAAIASQDEEEVWAMENLGLGKFKSRRLFSTINFDVGSAGLLLCDLDRDGRPDLLLPRGDNLEDWYGWPQPYHGCIWLQNVGGWNFRPKPIGNLGETYAASTGDVNGDTFPDVVLVSVSNDRNNAAHPSVVWLENDGQQNFTQHAVDFSPTRLVTVACGDLDGDGRADIVAGSLHVPPFLEHRVERVTTWIGRKAKP